jgi:hypothetical protein
VYCLETRTCSSALDGPDRLHRNDGSGKLKLVNDQYQYILGDTSGTLGIALADLNGDCKLDVVQAQGEGAWPEKVFLGKDIPADTASPVIAQVEKISSSEADWSVQIRARVHDNKSPTMPHDWRSGCAALDHRWAKPPDTYAVVR